MPAGPETWGLVADSPHPAAAQLFMDWLLSVPGQMAYSNAVFENSPREDVPPPPGGVAVSQLKLLFPQDWQAFFATRPEFAKVWNKMTGMR